MDRCSSFTTLSADGNMVDVCDRGADTFEFREHVFHSGRRFEVRASHNRSIHCGHGEEAPRALLHTFASTLRSLGWLVLWRGWPHLWAMLDGVHALRKRKICAST